MKNLILVNFVSLLIGLTRIFKFFGYPGMRLSGYSSPFFAIFGLKVSPSAILASLPRRLCFVLKFFVRVWAPNFGDSLRFSKFS